MRASDGPSLPTRWSTADLPGQIDRSYPVRSSSRCRAGGIQSAQSNTPPQNGRLEHQDPTQIPKKVIFPLTTHVEPTEIRFNPLRLGGHTCVLTHTSVAAGLMLLKTLLCSAMTFSACPMSVTYIRVRTTFSNEQPACCSRRVRTGVGGSRCKAVIGRCGCDWLLWLAWLSRLVCLAALGGCWIPRLAAGVAIGYCAWAPALGSCEWLLGLFVRLFG